jgi:hypothetical protein
MFVLSVASAIRRSSTLPYRPPFHLYDLKIGLKRVVIAAGVHAERRPDWTDVVVSPGS